MVLHIILHFHILNTIALFNVEFFGPDFENCDMKEGFDRSVRLHVTNAGAKPTTSHEVNPLHTQCFLREVHPFEKILYPKIKCAHHKITHSYSKCPTHRGKQETCHGSSISNIMNHKTHFAHSSEKHVRAKGFKQNCQGAACQSENSTQWAHRL